MFKKVPRRALIHRKPPVKKWKSQNKCCFFQKMSTYLLVNKKYQIKFIPKSNLDKVFISHSVILVETTT